MKKILVVEDDRAVSELLRHLLEGQDFIVECAFNGLAGLQKAREWFPDLILLDVNMPQMDGWQLLESLKSSPKTSFIPVIMCTEQSQIKEIEKAGDLGAVNYIIKPFHPDRVLKKIKETLGNS
ncbi:MAG: response regulator [Endomicrobiales bacterium]